MFVGWGLFHRKREKNQISRMKPLSNVMDGGDIRSIIRQKDENPPMQVPSIS